MSLTGNKSYEDLLQMMNQQQMMPVDGSSSINKISRPRPASIVRSTLQVYIGDPAWAFVGDPDEEDRLINMLRRAAINLTVSYQGRKVIIEIELKWTQ